MISTDVSSQMKRSATELLESNEISSGGCDAPAKRARLTSEGAASESSDQPMATASVDDLLLPMATNTNVIDTVGLKSDVADFSKRIVEDEGALQQPKKWRSHTTAPSALSHFVRLRRQDILSVRPDASKACVAQQLSERWALLSDIEKAPYKEQEEKTKEEMRESDRRRKGVPSIATSPALIPLKLVRSQFKRRLNCNRCLASRTTRLFRPLYHRILYCRRMRHYASMNLTRKSDQVVRIRPILS